MSKQVPIVAGPNKHEMAFRLVDGDNREQKTVVFTLNDGTQQWEEQVKLNGLQRESGSGENFNFDGINTANREHVRGYFDTKQRKGHMIFGQEERSEKIMSYDKKVAAGMSKVQEIAKMLEKGGDIKYMIVHNLPCLGCDRILKHACIVTSGGHPDKSLWNYIVHCSECNYGTNLAKFIPKYQFVG